MKSKILASSMDLKSVLEMHWVPPWAVRKSLAGFAYPATSTTGFLRMNIDAATLLGAEVSLSPLAPVCAGAGFHPGSPQPSFCGWKLLHHCAEDWWWMYPLLSFPPVLLDWVLLAVEGAGRCCLLGPQRGVNSWRFVRDAGLVCPEEP